MVRVSSSRGLAALAALAAGCDTGGVPVVEPGPSLLAQMISGRIAAEDIPDHGLVLEGASLYVVQVEELDPAWGELTSDLFTTSATEVIVTTLDSLRVISQTRGGERVTYLAVGTPRQSSESRWVLRLGADYAVAEPESSRTCCCTGEAIFEFGTDHFEFVEWGVIMCA